MNIEVLKNHITDYNGCLVEDEELKKIEPQARQQVAEAEAELNQLSSGALIQAIGQKGGEIEGKLKVLEVLRGKLALIEPCRAELQKKKEKSAKAIKAEADRLRSEAGAEARAIYATKIADITASFLPYCNGNQSQAKRAAEAVSEILPLRKCIDTFDSLHVGAVNPLSDAQRLLDAVERFTREQEQAG